MRWYKHFLILACTGLFFSSAIASDTADKIVSIDSMDKLYNQLKKRSDSLGQKIADAQEKIDTEKEGGKVNYWLPVIGGAVVGVGLAWWLKRRKKKE
jgi:LPXTG-motif cell wall-anchored protein